MYGYQNTNNFNEEQSAADLFDDVVAFELFFKTNFIPLCRYCQFKFGFSLELSKDIVHNSFVKLWESRRAIAPQLPVKPFLHRIINNSCLDVLKHDKVKKKYEQHLALFGKVQHNGNELANIEIRQLNKDIQAAVSGLPEQMQKIFKLCKYDGFTYAEAADQLNLSVKTVEKQMSRALCKLRQKLSGYLACHCLILLLIPKIFFCGVRVLL